MESSLRFYVLISIFVVINRQSFAVDPSEAFKIPMSPVDVIKKFPFFSVPGAVAPGTCVPTTSAVPATKVQPTCCAAIAYLGYGLQYPGPSDREHNPLPAWIDIPLAIKGQQIINENIFAITFASWFGIVASLMYGHLAEILLFAGGNVGGVPQKRYVATMAQLALWTRSVINTESNTENVIRSITNTRMIHKKNGNAARERLKTHKTLGNEKRYKHIKVRDPFWDAVRADMELHLKDEFKTFLPSYTDTLDSKVSMSQFDYAIVQWSAIGLVFLDPEKILLYEMTDDQLWAINHAWAVIGYAIGIDDAYNVCLQPDIVSQRKYFQDLFDYYVLPAVYSPSWECKVLVEMVASAFVGIAEMPYFGNETAEFALETFFKQFMLDLMGFPTTPNLDKIIGLPTIAFRKFYDEKFRESARLQTTKDVVNEAIETIVDLLVGKYYTGRPGNNDEIISREVFFPKPDPSYDK